MSNRIKYITKKGFLNGKEFAKINRHIDTCLSLLERLISFNHDCRKQVADELIIDEYIIDYRSDQFLYYENALKSIYYSCYSLKYVYDISTFMNFKAIENTIDDILEIQRRDITFTSIVKLSSIFEYTRKVYEKKIIGKNYFEKLKSKYSDKVHSLELLSNFRNTIHSNGKWDTENKKGDLRYMLRVGEQIIKSGVTFKYDHWKLYRIVKDCLELSKLMALDNEAEKTRATRLEINGQKLTVVKTEMTSNDWDNIFNKTK